MKAYWGSGGIAPLIIDLGTRWGLWSASRPGRLTPRERAPGTHWTGGLLGLRAVLDAVVKRRIPTPRRESNPRTPKLILWSDIQSEWSTQEWWGQLLLLRYIYVLHSYKFIERNFNLYIRYLVQRKLKYLTVVMFQIKTWIYILIRKKLENLMSIYTVPKLTLMFLIRHDNIFVGA
jgi:hypothetical protein